MIPLIPVDTIAGEMARHLWMVSLQAGVLALFALLAERLFRNAPPGFRYWLWMLVVIRLAVPVDFTLPFGMRGQVRDGIAAVIEHLPRRDIPAASTVTARSTPDNPVPGAAPAFTPLPKPAPPAHRQFPAKTVLTVWAGISALLLAAMLTQCVLFRWRLRNSRPVLRRDCLALIGRLRHETGLRRRVTLMRDDAGLVHAPAVAGVLRPRIWLPGPMVDSWPPGDLEPVLLHELAHVKRHDLPVNRLQTLVQAIWFFHPLLWLANHRIRSIREEICDDLAVAALPSGRERYALSMIRAGEEILRQRGFAFAGAGFSERKSSLGARVRRIMDGKYSPHRKMSAGTAAVLLMVVALGAALASERQKKKPEFDVANGIKNEAENPHAPVIQLGGDTVNGRIEGKPVLVPMNGKAITPVTAHAISDPDSQGTLLSHAAELMVAGKLEEADRAFRNFITRFPKSPQVPRAEYYRAFCAYNLRRFHDAERLFGAVVSAYPDSAFIPEALFYRADGNYNLGNFAEAVRGFDELITRFPDSPKAEEGMFTRAWALLDIGRERESLETLRMLVEKYPGGRFAASALFSIGSYRYQTGNFEAAREALKELLERYPDSTVASKARDMLRAIEKTPARQE